MSEFIVKIQRALSTSDGSAPVLIYNEDKSVLNEVDMPEDEVNRLLPNGVVKIYRTAILGNDGIINIGDEVEAQDW